MEANTSDSNGYFCLGDSVLDPSSVAYALLPRMRWRCGRGDVIQAATHFDREAARTPTTARPHRARSLPQRPGPCALACASAEPFACTHDPRALFQKGAKPMSASTRLYASQGYWAGLAARAPTHRRTQPPTPTPAPPPQRVHAAPRLCLQERGGGGGVLLAPRPTRPKKILTQKLAEGKLSFGERPVCGTHPDPPPWRINSLYTKPRRTPN